MAYRKFMEKFRKEAVKQGTEGRDKVQDAAETGDLVILPDCIGYNAWRIIRKNTVRIT